MRFSSLTLAACIAAAGAVSAAESVAPADVAYEDGAVAASLSGAAGNAENGRAVMTNRGLGNCVACHEVTALKDAPFHGEVGPPLDGVADRWSEAELRGIVANAKMTYEGSVMPAFYKTSGFIRPGDGYTGDAATAIEPILSAQDVEDVVAFLMTLKE
jgi:sulfur-oxidizing protein SoxX